MCPVELVWFDLSEVDPVLVVGIVVDHSLIVNLGSTLLLNTIKIGYKTAVLKVH